MASYNIKQRRVKELRAQLPQACATCGETDGLTLDHIIPVSKGGAKYDLANLQLLCAPCNTKKSNKLPHVLERERQQDEDWRLLQEREPERAEMLSDMARIKHWT